MDKAEIIENFIRNFILKDKRERSLFELTHPQKRNLFAGKLNHDWATLIDMRKLTSLPKKENQYNFVKDNLKIKDTDLSYLISNYDDIDNEIIEFKRAFDKSWGRGLATLIIVTSSDKIYLEAEQVQGSPDRFIGRA